MFDLVSIKTNAKFIVALLGLFSIGLNTAFSPVPTSTLNERPPRQSEQLPPLKPRKQSSTWKDSLLCGSESSEEILNEYRCYEFTASKPLGIILESDVDDDNNNETVRIARIDPKGNTASASVVAKSSGVCINDVVLGVEGCSCVGAGWTLERVMEAIADAPPIVTLTLGRKYNANGVGVVVRWPNGVGVATCAGESLRRLAGEALYSGVTYSCDSGGCGTCEHLLVVGDVDGDNDENGDSVDDYPPPRPRYIRPCVARVPRGQELIRIVPSDRYEPS